MRPALLLVLGIASLPLATAASFGPLPPGATSTNIVSDVRAEICRDHLFDASRLRATLPPGYHLLRARDHAKDDPGVAPLLARLPRHSEYAIGPRDSRMQGKVEWLQLASWYSRELTERQRILATDPMAQFVDLRVTQAGPNHWRLRLVLPGETLLADVQGSGQRTKRTPPEPGYMSVPFTGAAADRFWVITYFGHQHQAAQGRWRARGRGVFSDALSIPGEETTFATVFQDGWSALAGVYAVER